MFAITADPERFDESADWFLKRVVLTEREAAELGADAGRRAFWVGNGLQLDAIQRVFDEIKKAQDSGEPFEEWRKRVKGDLPNDAHAETVFRNAAQRALNAGRWEQMVEPSVAKFRPFWMFDAVLDTRTTQVCIVCNQTILPIEHPWWLTHAPPCHHRCRSGLRSLRREVALQKGLTNVPPAIDSAEGFGLAPHKQPVWKPDPAKHDPALVAELNRKAKRKPKAPPAPPKLPKKHDPAHWEEQYRKGAGIHSKDYGEAAPGVGWGRAMLERGLDRTAADVKAELGRLADAGYPGLNRLQLRWLDELEPNRPLRKQASSQSPRIKALIALQEHTRTIQTGESIREFSDSSEGLTEARVFYKLVLDRAVKRPRATLSLRSGNVRAYYSPRDDHIVLGRSDRVDVAVHELAHAIEAADVRAIGRSQAFLDARTLGEKEKSLRSLTGKPYGSEEVAKPDKFINPYIGKQYRKSVATEVTSMGYQALVTDPLNDDSYADLADSDPEMLFFLLGQLAGR